MVNCILSTGRVLNPAEVATAVFYAAGALSPSGVPEPENRLVVILKNCSSLEVTGPVAFTDAKALDGCGASVAFKEPPVQM